MNSDLPAELADEKLLPLLRMALKGEHILLVGPNEAAKQELLAALAARLENFSVFAFSSHISALEIKNIMLTTPHLVIISSLRIANRATLFAQFAELGLQLSADLLPGVFTAGFEDSVEKVPAQLAAQKAAGPSSKKALPALWLDDVRFAEPGWELEGQMARGESR